jgi:hypothetical protein
MNQLEEVDNILANNGKVDLIRRDEEAAKIADRGKPAEAAKAPDEDDLDITRDSA